MRNLGDETAHILRLRMQRPQIRDINDLSTKDLLTVRSNALVNLRRLTIKSDDKINLSIECWIKAASTMYTTAELPYGDNGKIKFPDDYNVARILKTRQGWESRGVAHGIISSHVPNDDTAFRTMEGAVIDPAGDDYKKLIADLQVFSRAEVLLAQQTMWIELHKHFDPRTLITSTEAAAQLYATLSVTALNRETRNRIFADPTAIDEGINKAASRPVLTLPEFNQKSGEIMLWIEAEGILQGLAPGAVLPSTFRRMKQGLQTSMLLLPVQDPRTSILCHRVSIAFAAPDIVESQEPEKVLQAIRLVYATVPVQAAAGGQAPAAVVMHVTDRYDRPDRPLKQGRGGKFQATRGVGKGRSRGSPPESQIKPRPRKASPRDDASPPKKPRFNVPLSERLDNSDQSLRSLMEEVGSLKKQLAEFKSQGSALHTAMEPESDTDEEYEQEPVRTKKGPANQKQSWTRVPRPAAFMASLLQEDDSDDMPDLVDSSDEDEEEPAAPKRIGVAKAVATKNLVARRAPEPVIHYEVTDLYAPVAEARSGIVNGHEDDSEGMPELVSSSDDEDGDNNVSAAKKLKESAAVFIKEVIDSAATSVLANGPDLISSPAKNNEPAIRGTIESKQARNATPKADTSGSPANNQPGKSPGTKTQKGSPMGNLTNAPRRSGRTPVRVENYKPTSRSVNKAQSENDATGKPYVSKKQEGATMTRAGMEPEGARKSTASQGEPVEVHYLVYVDDVVEERVHRSAAATHRTSA